MTKSKKIITAACLIAINIVFSRFFSIKTPILTIGFGFIPLISCAMILGFKYSMLVGGISDLIGALIFPVGAYFPGFTLSSVLAGLIYGLFLHNKKSLSDKQILIRLIISSCLVLLLINGVMNTFWLYIITSKATLFLSPIRFIKQLIMLPIQVIIMFTLYKSLKVHVKQNLMEAYYD